MKKIKKEVIVKYIVLTITLFFAAISFNIFILPLKIVLGGNNGVAVLFSSVFKINSFITLIFISIFFLIVSFFLLDRRQTISIAYSSLIYPILVRLTYPLAKILSINIDDMLLTSIYVGVLSGITNGMIIRLGFNNGGINVIGNLFYKYFKISYSKTIFVINTIIVLLGSTFLGINNILYAVIILYINSYVVDRVILNNTNYKLFEVVTKKSEEIEKYIKEKLNRTYTKINIDNKKKLLITVIKTNEYRILKEYIKLVDKNAFFLIKDSYDAKTNN